MAIVTYDIDVGQVFYLEKIAGVWTYVSTEADPSITFDDIDGDWLVDDGEIGVGAANDFGLLSGTDGSLAVITSGSLATFYSNTVITDPATFDFHAAMSSLSNNFVDLAFCFAHGTEIETETGIVEVSDLRVGDRVVTRDNGLQEVKWIGSRYLSKIHLAGNPNLCPITIKKGALSQNIPSKNLTVSPQHRVLICDWRAELLYGCKEVLVPTKALVNDGSISISHFDAGVTYYHILCDEHQLLNGNGCWSESFHPGEEGIRAVSEEARAELLEIFPELENDTFGMKQCLPSVSVREGRAIRL